MVAKTHKKTANRKTSRGRPKTKEDSRPLAVRLPLSTIEAIDRYRADLEIELAGVPISRNGAIARLLKLGLNIAIRPT